MLMKDTPQTKKAQETKQKNKTQKSAHN